MIDQFRASTGGPNFDPFYHSNTLWSIKNETLLFFR